MLRRYRLSVALFVWLGCVACAVGAAESAGNKTERTVEVEEQLKHAETYYWFGMAELGNLQAFYKGYAHLWKAEQLVEDGPFSLAEKEQYRKRIYGLRTDLKQQVEIAHDTLYGLFPLTRFLRPSIFADSTTLDTFEVIDDPRVMATTFAARKLSLEVIKQWTGRHHLDCVFNSVPRTPDLENEALYLFNTSPKFFVHNYREVVDALDDAQEERFFANDVGRDIQIALLEKWKIRDLLIVTVHEVDIVDDDYFYVVEGKIVTIDEDPINVVWRKAFGSNLVKSRPTHNFMVMGFSRDRNDQFWPIIIINAVLLLVAVLIFWLLTRSQLRAGAMAQRASLVLVPVTAFAVGRFLAWAVAPMLSRISQIPETLAIVSWWTPCLAGFALLLLPMLAFWLVGKRFLKFLPIFNVEGRMAATFIAVGCGGVGYLAVPLLMFLQSAGIAILIPLALATILLGYLLGRAMDSRDKTHFVVSVVPVVLSLGLGAAVFHCSLPLTWITTGMVALVAATPVAADIRRELRIALEQTSRKRSPLSAPVETGPLNAEWLADRIEAPEFQQLPGYEQCWSKVTPFLNGQSVHLFLYGTGGCGVSATANAVADQLARSLESSDRKVARMSGECSQPVGEPTPFGPFRQALAKHFQLDLLGADDDSNEQMDAALGELFQSVIPLGGMLFTGSGGGSVRVSSSEEIHSSIAWMLRRLSRRSYIILLIDDAQWLDSSSQSLLRYLIQQFPPGGTHPIAIIVASHEQTALGGLGSDVAQHEVHIPYPSTGDLTKLLIDGIGFAPLTAEQIVDHFGSDTEAQGGLFWVLQVLANLARANVFVRTDQGIALVDNKWPTHVVIPDKMRDVLREQIRSHPEHRQIIECAACASERREFSASLVAEALNLSRLELLTELDRIDRETSIIYDVRERDDSFAYQSSFMLEAVRQEFHITEDGPQATDVPQLVREYHSRLAGILEKSLQKSSRKLYRVANHYYAAGGLHAEKAMKYCLEAARMACSVVDFDASQRYLERAEHAAKLIGQMDAIEMERLYIKCQRAHMSGNHQQLEEVSNLAKIYLDAHDSASVPLMLAIAQVHYDAGKTSGEPAWFAKSLEIGRQIIDRAQTPLDTAIGHHVVGISLPLTQRDERRRELRTAMELIDQDSDDSFQHAETLGRILGSLAEELSRGSAEQRDEARKLFERRLELTEQYKIADPQGQAMTHGGLGRLSFFTEVKDIKTARFHFEKDLEISEAIGDVQGQVQMHSLLGACALEENDLESALSHYEMSFDLSHDTISKVFALSGLLRCHAGRQAIEQLQAAASQLLESAKLVKLPEVCAETIVTVLEQVDADLLCDDSRKLQLLAQSQLSAEAAT